MAHFTAEAFEFDVYVVSGTDDNGVTDETLLVSHSWAAVEHVRKHEIAEGIFDAAVKAHYAELLDAADQAKAVVTDSLDEFRKVGFVVPVEGVEAQDLELNDEAGIILHIIDKGRFDLLRWIGGKLAIKRVV